MNDGLWAPRGPVARAIVLVAMITNLSAALLMATLMKDSTGAGGSDVQRMAFIASHETMARVFWYCWELATLSLVATFVAVLRSLDAPGTAGLRMLSFALLAMGAVPDSINNLIGAEVLPDLAVRWTAATDPVLRGALEAQFHSWDRLSVVLTGGLANGLYAAGGWLLFAASRQTSGYPRRLILVQWPLWTATTCMSIAAVANSVPALIATVGVTMACMVLWSTGTAVWWLGRR